MISFDTEFAGVDQRNNDITIYEHLFDNVAKYKLIQVGISICQD